MVNSAHTCHRHASVRPSKASSFTAIKSLSPLFVPYQSPMVAPAITTKPSSPKTNARIASYSEVPFCHRGAHNAFVRIIHKPHGIIIMSTNTPVLLHSITLQPPHALHLPSDGASLSYPERMHSINDANCSTSSVARSNWNWNESVSAPH